MEKGKSDLDAVKIIVEALEGFESKDQERIIRWVREKIGLQIIFEKQAVSLPQIIPDSESLQAQRSQVISQITKDIKSFVTEKAPKNDQQFSAVVAYYYQFIAPPDERIDTIDSKVLQDATRKSDHERLKKPIYTLNNAFKSGLLDKTGEPGVFRLNSVGENLVAMVLPDKGDERRSKVQKRKTKIKHGLRNSSRKVRRKKL